MTNEKIEEAIEAVEAIKADCEKGRDKALERRMNGDVNAASDYLFWVGNVEACERELKRFHSEYAKNILEARDGHN